ncbi:MAG: Pr6Pr family membrane protein [Rhodoglobus sp.]|nr:Pr6Pr family membrane protein [Rhodoglobus sp.]
MKFLFASLRAFFGLAGLVSVIATFLDTASRVAINPFNFFGFFTMQSNILTIIVLLAAAASTFAGRPQSKAFLFARACVTTYIVIVGIVYNTLLVGLEGGISLEWANWVLHVSIPIYVALDWIFFGDRAALPWSRFWVVLIYPITWIVVVLARGATDGWVPYPFLDPALGYGVVAGYCVAIAAATAVVGAGVWAVSRVRILKP